MTTTNPSAEYFDQVADRWDSLRSGYFTEAVRDAAIARAYLHPDMIVADVGAGTGFLAAGLAPLVRHVHVVDGAPAMLEVARKNLSAFGNLEFHQADGLSLPLPDVSTGATVSSSYVAAETWRCGSCASGSCESSGSADVGGDPAAPGLSGSKACFPPQLAAAIASPSRTRSASERRMAGSMTPWELTPLLYPCRAASGDQERLSRSARATSLTR